MRTIRSIVAGVVLCGCAGTRDRQGKSAWSHAASVVLEPPTITVKPRYNRLRQEEQTASSATEAQGAFER